MNRRKLQIKFFSHGCLLGLPIHDSLQIRLKACLETIGSREKGDHWDLSSFFQYWKNGSKEPVVKVDIS